LPERGSPVWRYKSVKSVGFKTVVALQECHTGGILQAVVALRRCHTGGSLLGRGSPGVTNRCHTSDVVVQAVEALQKCHTGGVLQAMVALQKCHTSGVTLLGRGSPPLRGFRAVC
jgi:hypothetical protein